MAKNSAKAVLTAATDEWQAQTDLDCLMRASEIRKDKKRMDAVRKIAKERLAELAKVAVDVDNDPASEPDNDGDE